MNSAEATITGGGAMFGAVVGAVLSVQKNYGNKKIAIAVIGGILVGAVAGYGIATTINLVELNKKES